ncbi:SRPBCC family protein [Pseudalkalibacillus berkeleyi]|uniref:SRPBCC domain-containing protein n=1 Tax=Pseudalkalibacillus berkeleyi TaxID=1069813 RepID=A0ABS9H523_9BACL|nr:SRPBCC domain-containing protein [Pseudalkalibacillus berkeleyi]MCF6139050.1 SRPBCC domain-containing protein [Pseudalkalibacillus berkeleyi]
MITMQTEQNYKLELNKVFPVKVDKVFKAWTDSTELAKWWGPEGYTTNIEKMDVEVDGEYKFIMNPPEGDSHVLVGRYVEIVPNEKLVFTWKWDNNENEFPETLVTVGFIDQDGSTELTIKHEQLPSEEAAEGHNKGWSSSLEGSLKTYLG